jgi:hypothetical protein
VSWGRPLTEEERERRLASFALERPAIGGPDRDAAANEASIGAAGDGQRGRFGLLGIVGLLAALAAGVVLIGAVRRPA